jgi:hypothetical protein
MQTVLSCGHQPFQKVSSLSQIGKPRFCERGSPRIRAVLAAFAGRRPKAARKAAASGNSSITQGQAFSDSFSTLTPHLPAVSRRDGAPAAASAQGTARPTDGRPQLAACAQCRRCRGLGRRGRQRPAPAAGPPPDQALRPISVSKGFLGYTSCFCGCTRELGADGGTC